jgi:hypothetical protein
MKPGNWKFADALDDTRQKTDNHRKALPAKTEIRRNVLEAIGAERAAVFDGMAGAGEMWRRVWCKAHDYVGCDTTWYRDERVVYVADCCRVLRAIDVQRFNIFDIDPYGSPWEPIIILAARRSVASGERIGLVLSEGSSIKARMGTLGRDLAYLARLRAKLPGGAKELDEVIDRALFELLRRMRCRMLHRWQARIRYGAHMRYIGLVLEGM